MSGRRGEKGPGQGRGKGQGRGVICDFCGEPAESVQRVALDGDYERLRTPHAVKFACPECSARKEADRKGEEP